MFLNTFVAITLLCSWTMALNNTDGFTPWGRPRIQLPQGVAVKEEQTKCMTTCSLSDPNVCQTICPRDPTQHESVESQVNIQVTPVPTANLLAQAIDQNTATTLPLSPPLQETASLLLADGVPLPSPEDLALLTETLSLLRGLGLQVPPEKESWVGFSLDDKSNAELERMLGVLEPYVGELPAEEVEEDEGEGDDI